MKKILFIIGTAALIAGAAVLVAYECVKEDETPVVEEVIITPVASSDSIMLEDSTTVVSDSVVVE